MKNLFLLSVFCLIVFTFSNSTLRKVYDLLDTNKDNVVTLNEIVAHLERMEDDFELSPQTKLEIRRDASLFLKMWFPNGDTSFEAYLKSNQNKFPNSPTEPQQLRLATTLNKDEMLVMWATKKPTKTSVVKYGITTLDQQEKGYNYTYYLPSPHDTDTWIHSVVLKNLRLGVTYKYQCGDEEGGWSKEFYFKTKLGFPLSLSVVGDMGIVPFGAGVSKFISDNYNKRPFDMQIILGDVAYADFGSNGRQESQALWDMYQNQVEPYAKHSPFMVVSGNHEQALADTPLNYTSFSHRFTMPKNGYRNQYFSYDYGGVHFISMNTEERYDSSIPNSVQYKWLEEDLIKANRNRHNVPWIFFMGHRPMYDLGITSIGRNVESLIVKHKVDIALSGHIHCYYRSWPVIQQKPTQTFPNNIYRNPNAPVHLMIGTGGARINSNEPCSQTKPEHMAHLNMNYGFGRLDVINATSLHFEFLRWTTNKVDDEFWIHKN